MKNNMLIVLASFIAIVFGVNSYLWLRSDFTTLDDQSYSWRNLTGNWVVVNYFAEWCAPCLSEVPELNRFNQFAEQQQDLNVFAISFDKLTTEELKRIKQQYNMEFKLIASDNPKMPNKRPGGLPATFIISPDGKVVKQLMGEQSADSLTQVIARLRSNYEQ